MDAGDRELFERSLREATGRCRGDALDVALEELGWHDALAADPRDAVSILFELQGEANATSSALSAVLAPALDTHDAEVVLPALGQWRAPGMLEGDRVVVDGLARRADDRLLVVAQAGDNEVALLVATANVDVRPVQGIDPALGLLRIQGEADATDPQPVDWTAAVAVGQRAIAHELVGVSRKLLQLAREHALDRVQFDRPIAMFQAVRHRLAETLVAIEAADAALTAAWDDETPSSSAMAKALAGRGARVAARHCQQVLAGIGFTTEHPLHLFIRRALVLDQLLGSAKLLTAELGSSLIATRQLPPLHPL